jgi:hypothetical protein
MRQTILFMIYKAFGFGMYYLRRAKRKIDLGVWEQYGEPKEHIFYAYVKEH